MIGGTVVTDTTGLTAIHDSLKQRAITLKAVKAGAKIVLTATKAGVPQDTRSLKKSQGTKAGKSKAGQTLSYAVIGARKKTDVMVIRKGRRKPTRAVPAFYDHLVRLGAKPHSVAKGQSLGRVQKTSKTGKLYGKLVTRTDQSGGQHPGTKPNDFRLKGWESSKDAAGAATLAVMGAEVNKAMAEQSRSILAKLGGG